MIIYHLGAFLENALKNQNFPLSSHCAMCMHGRGKFFPFLPQAISTVHAYFVSNPRFEKYEKSKTKNPRKAYM